MVDPLRTSMFFGALYHNEPPNEASWEGRREVRILGFPGLALAKLADVALHVFAWQLQFSLAIWPAPP